MPYIWTLFLAVCWYKEDDDSWGFTFANYFLFVTNTMQYCYPVKTEESKMAATKTIYRFFAFGGVEMLFLQNFNNLKMGITLSWLAVLAPIQGTLLSIFKIAKHFHMISHHPESSHRSRKMCITSIMLAVLLGYAAWLITVFGQMTTDVP